TTAVPTRRGRLMRPRRSVYRSGSWYNSEYRTRMATTVDLRTKAIVLHVEDDVAIAKAPIAAGLVLEDGDRRLTVVCDIRPGRKVAGGARARGEPVRRYGQVIGFATEAIAEGEHVHTHNLAVGELQQDYQVGTDVRPVAYYPPAEMRYFDGFKRADGRVGTR